MATDVYGPPNPSQLQQKASDVDLMPVRETLNKQFGIDDKRIGYNPQSGYVTIDNQNVLRPPVNRAGSTYAGQDVFNSAAGQINTLNNAYNLQQQVLNPQQQANPYDNRVEQVLQQLSAPQQRVNPIDAQLQAFMSQLMQRTQNPTVIDRNAAYQSPQYAAYQAQAQKQAQGATRQAQEALGASRLGRSSVLADRAQGIQNDANQFLETQAVPQIIAQLQAQEDAQTQGLYNLINALSQQQSVYDTRMSQEDARLYNIMNALTQQQGIHDTRGNQQYDRAAQVLDYLTGRQDRAQDVDFRNRQFDQGVAERDRDFNRGVFESDRAFDTSERQYADQRGDVQYERAYREARDQIGDERWKVQFDEDVRRYGIDSALQHQVQLGNLSVAQANAALSRERFGFDREMALRQDARQEAQTGEKINPNEIQAEVIGALDGMTPDQQAAFFAGERASIIRDLGIDGYNKLYNQYFDEYGEPKRR